MRRYQTQPLRRASPQLPRKVHKDRTLFPGHRPLMVSVKQVSSSPLFSHRQLVDALGRRVAWTTGHRIGLIESCRQGVQWRQVMRACHSGTPAMFKIYDNKPVINIRFDKESVHYFPPAITKATANGPLRRGRSTTKLIEKVEAVLTKALGAESKAAKQKRKPRSCRCPPKEPPAASSTTKRTLEPRPPDFPPRVVKAAARRTHSPSGRAYPRPRPSYHSGAARSGPRPSPRPASSFNPPPTASPPQVAPRAPPVPEVQLAIARPGPSEAPVFAASPDGVALFLRGVADFLSPQPPLIRLTESAPFRPAQPIPESGEPPICLSD